MAVNHPLSPHAVADRVGEIVRALYFGAKVRRFSRNGEAAGLQRMLGRLGVVNADFGGEWSRTVHGLAAHAELVCKKRPSCGSCPLVSFCAMGQEKVRRGRKYVVVDLFAGSGGLGSGFRNAGFRIGLAIENDRDAAQTYRLNNPGVPVFEMNVARVTAKWLVKVIARRPDVICAGPPCQSFSAAGTRNHNDPRHNLFRHVLSLARQLNPHAVVIENVPGIARKLTRNRNYRDVLVRELGRSFDSEVLLLEASDYGVPQIRRRYIFIGRRPGTPRIGLPPRTHSVRGGDDLPRPPTVMQVLARLPKRRHSCKKDWYRRKDGSTVHNLTTMAHSRRVVSKISKIKGGEGPISYRRVSRSYARTIVAGHRALPLHPTLHRTMSVREAASIQSFPEAYIFLGCPANQPLQVANAVPPPLAEAIASRVRVHIATVMNITG